MNENESIIRILNDIRMTANDARIYKEFLYQRIPEYSFNCYTTNFMRIERESFLASIIGREEAMYKRILELEDKVRELELDIKK